MADYGIELQQAQERIKELEKALQGLVDSVKFFSRSNTFARNPGLIQSCLSFQQARKVLGEDVVL